TQIRTTRRRLLRQPNRRRSASRTRIRKLKRLRSRRPFFLHHRNHRRNNFARLLHHHEISDPHILSRDFSRVMQRRSRNRRSRQHHRVQFRHRRQSPRPPHLNPAPVQARFRLLRREFVSDRPTRSLRRRTRLLLPRQRIQLHYRSIGWIREGMPQPVHRLH